MKIMKLNYWFSKLSSKTGLTGLHLGVVVLSWPKMLGGKQGKKREEQD